MTPETWLRLADAESATAVGAGCPPNASESRAATIAASGNAHSIGSGARSRQGLMCGHSSRYDTRLLSETPSGMSPEPSRWIFSAALVIFVSGMFIVIGSATPNWNRTRLLVSV